MNSTAKRFRIRLGLLPLLSALLIASLPTVSLADPASPATTEAKTQQVQRDVRELIEAVYAADVDTVLKFTHPNVLQAMGGVEKARPMLENTFAQLKQMQMRLETLTFPAPPTFLEGTEHEFALVPTKIVILAGDQRAESLNFQFGSRRPGEDKWVYIEGSRINSQNVHQFFPDFPRDYTFPEVYRKKL